jgi:hypothetical protein
MLTEKEKDELRKTAADLPSNDFIYKEIAKHLPEYDVEKAQRESKAMALWLGSLGEIDDDCPDSKKRLFILITSARFMNMSSLELDDAPDRFGLLEMAVDMNIESPYRALMLAELARQKTLNYEGSWILSKKD